MLEIGRHKIRVPEGSDGPPHVPTALLNMATDLSNVAMDTQGTLAARPVSTALQPSDVPGRYYFVTGDPDPAQNRRLWRDTGAGWEEVPIGPGRRPELGDFKMSAQAADHGDLGGGAFAWLLCDARELPAAQSRLVTFLQGIGSPFGVGANGRPLLPDPAGRVPVFVGQHADVNALGDSDGEAVANRSPKHHHGTHSHGISDMKGSNITQGASAHAALRFDGYDVDYGGLTIADAQVGPLGTPLHGPAHIVLGRLFICAG